MLQEVNQQLEARQSRQHHFRITPGKENHIFDITVTIVSGSARSRLLLEWRPSTVTLNL